MSPVTVSLNVAGLALVGDRAALRSSERRGLALRGGRYLRSELVPVFLHARRAVAVPVHIDHAVVLAAIGLAGGDRRRQLYRPGAVGEVGIGVVRPLGANRVIGLVATG